MANQVTSLTTVRDNILAKLEEISVNPKPNYSIDGQTVNHADFFASLLKSLEQTNRALAASESYEFIEQAYT
jgi:hypothetical protein